jgi:beta-glucosidase
MGAASTVLLKNKNCALPLGKHDGKAAERSLVLIGSDAGPGRMGPNEFSDQGGVITGTLAMGWGSGTANFTYLVNVSGETSPISFGLQFDNEYMFLAAPSDST